MDIYICISSKVRERKRRISIFFFKVLETQLCQKSSDRNQIQTQPVYSYEHPYIKLRLICGTVVEKMIGK